MEILHIQQGELASTQGTQFFFFGEGGGCWIFLVPIVFPISSQNVPQVPNVFPQHVHLTLSNMILPCPNFYSCNLYKQPKGGDYYSIYLFGDSPKLDKKFLCWVNQRCPSQKKKIALGGFGGSTQLINMSHTLYHYKIQRRNGNNKQNRENWGWL
jgi:hypothetical protein